MLGLYRSNGKSFDDCRHLQAGLAPPLATPSASAASFFDADSDGRLDLAVARHIDDTVRTSAATWARPVPATLLNQSNVKFLEVAAELGGGFAQSKVGRVFAVADFDRDGDLDLLLTTNNGPPISIHDQLAGNRSIRLQLIGTNQSATLSRPRPPLSNGQVQSRLVRSGSSYLSQSELPLTFA